MPNFEEHCQSCFRKLGCRFERIHKWMDSPAKFMGPNHRLRRHNPYETPEIAKELFSRFYPSKNHLIKEAVLDHIELDRKTSEISTRITRKERIKASNQDYNRKQAIISYAKVTRFQDDISKAKNNLPIWLGALAGSIIGFYFSNQYYPNDLLSSTILGIALFVILCVNFNKIGTLLSPGAGIVWVFIFFINIGATLFMIYSMNMMITIIAISINIGTLILIAFCLKDYFKFKKFLKELEEYKDEQTKSTHPSSENKYDSESQKFKNEFQKEFEENNEANGYPSSAVMDEEDLMD